MLDIKFLLTLTVFLIVSREINGHGMILDPAARASAWRIGFDTKKYYDDNQLWCGGATKQHQHNGGRCGVCGDDFSMEMPRPNENGGTYGTGAIVKTYTSGQVTNITVRVTSNHKGRFYFSVCPLQYLDEFETEECFDANPVMLADGQDSYELKSGLHGDIPVSVVLPKDLTCQHCVFRWHWITGNNWGHCGDGTSKVGCGPQEEFRNCADITIEEDPNSLKHEDYITQIPDTTTEVNYIEV